MANTILRGFSLASGVWLLAAGVLAGVLLLPPLLLQPESALVQKSIRQITTASIFFLCFIILFSF